VLRRMLVQVLISALWCSSALRVQWDKDHSGLLQKHAEVTTETDGARLQEVLEKIQEFSAMASGTQGAPQVPTPTDMRSFFTATTNLMTDGRPLSTAGQTTLNDALAAAITAAPTEYSDVKDEALGISDCVKSFLTRTHPGTTANGYASKGYGAPSYGTEVTSNLWNWNAIKDCINLQHTGTTYGALADTGRGQARDVYNEFRGTTIVTDSNTR